RRIRVQSERARAAQEIVHLARRVLERELDVVEPGLLERLDALLREPYPGRDQIDVVPEPMRLRDDLLEIVARERLTAGKPELHRAERARLVQHANPRRRIELGPDVGHVRRVVAEHAVERTAIRQLAEEPQRRSCRFRCAARIGRRGAHSSTSSHCRSTASATNASTSAASPAVAYVRSRSPTISPSVRVPSQRLMIAPALPLSFTTPSG